MQDMTIDYSRVLKYQGYLEKEIKSLAQDYRDLAYKYSETKKAKSDSIYKRFSTDYGITDEYFNERSLYLKLRQYQTYKEFKSFISDYYSQTKEKLAVERGLIRELINFNPGYDDFDEELEKLEKEDDRRVKENSYLFKTFSSKDIDIVKEFSEKQSEKNMNYIMCLYGLNEKTNNPFKSKDGKYHLSINDSYLSYGKSNVNKYIEKVLWYLMLMDYMDLAYSYEILELGQDYALIKEYETKPYRLELRNGRIFNSNMDDCIDTMKSAYAKEDEILVWISSFENKWYQ